MNDDEIAKIIKKLREEEPSMEQGSIVPDNNKTPSHAVNRLVDFNRKLEAAKKEAEKIKQEKEAEKIKQELNIGDSTIIHDDIIPPGLTPIQEKVYLYAYYKAYFENIYEEFNEENGKLETKSRKTGKLATEEEISATIIKARKQAYATINFSSKKSLPIFLQSIIDAEELRLNSEKKGDVRPEDSSIKHTNYRWFWKRYGLVSNNIIYSITTRYKKLNYPDSNMKANEEINKRITKLPEQIINELDDDIPKVLSKPNFSKTAQYAYDQDKKRLGLIGEEIKKEDPTIDDDYIK